MEIKSKGEALYLIHLASNYLGWTFMGIPTSDALIDDVGQGLVIGTQEFVEQVTQNSDFDNNL